MNLGIKSILKHSIKYTGASTFVALLSIPKNIILAIVLTPSDFGFFSALWLFAEWAYLLGPGFLNSSVREFNYHFGKNEFKKADAIEREGNGADLIYTVFICILIAISGLLYSKKEYIFGFIIVSVNHFFNKFILYYYNANYYRDKYNVTASARVIQNGGAALISVALVFFIKEWALFFGQLFASILTVIYYKLKAPYKMHFLFSKKQAFFLFKTGFFLSIAWVLWGAFKFIDKTVISIYLPEFELGLFTFALTFIYFFYNAMLDFGNVLMPILWRAWSDKNPFEFKNISKKYAYFFSISSGLLIPVFQIGYYFIVSFLVKDFATKDNFFNVLTLNLFFLTIVILPNIMLASKNINKQYFTAITHFIGIIANIILCILLIKAGYSLLGVAIAATVTKSIISIFQYGFSLKYFEDGITKKIIFVFKLFLPFIINVLLLLLQMLLQKLCNNRIIFMILHASAVAIVFIPVLFFVYPEVIRFSEIKRMFKDKKV